MEASLANGPTRPTDWQTVNWRQVNRRVRNLRQRIFRASQQGDHKTVSRLQKLMLRSYANRLQAVRRVTQINHGKDTPGVDKVVIKTPAARGKLEQPTESLAWFRKAAMAEVASGVGWTDEIDGRGQRRLQSFLSLHAHTPQVCLDLAECQLDGVEVGGIAGQEEQATPGTGDSRSDGLLLVDVQVVHDHNLARMKRRDQDVLHIAAEELAVDGAIDDHAGADPIRGAGGDQREVGRIVAGGGPRAALAAESTTVAAGQRQVSA